MSINIKVPYSIDDAIYDIVSKNKFNIEDLYEQLSKQPTQDDIDKINKLIGSYQADDPNGQLDSNQSVIANLVVVKENLTSALNRIKSNEERLTKAEPTIIENTKKSDGNSGRLDRVEPLVTDNTNKSKSNEDRLVIIEPKIIENTTKAKSNEDRLVVVEPIVRSNTNRLTIVEPVVTTHTNEIRKLQTDGIGNYIGTFKGDNGDDVSALPVNANDNERAIIEFLVGDDEKYQEYKSTNKIWSKVGVVTDSHIHSQSSGISLDDVANFLIKYEVGSVPDAIFGTIEHTKLKALVAIGSAKLYLTKGYGKVSGTEDGVTTGEIKSHDHTQAGHSHNASQGNHGHSIGITTNQGSAGGSNSEGTMNGREKNGTQATNVTIGQASAGAINISPTTPVINSTGGNANLGAGHYVYSVQILKSVTFKQWNSL